MTYKFCIINDDIFHIILSFLGNQSLVKLQSITNDVYPNSNILISTFCCSKCENDNPAIQDSLCTKCYINANPKSQKITKTMAKSIYGIKDFTSITAELHPKYTLYRRYDLDRHMISFHKSKFEWINAIATSKLKKQNKHNKQHQILNKCLANKAFKDYYNKYSEVININNIKIIFERFSKLEFEIKSYGLNIRHDSHMCNNYILAGQNDPFTVAQIMEEMDFLFTKTNYKILCNNNIKAFKSDLQLSGSHISREEYNYLIEQCKEEVKEQIRVEYLSKNDTEIPSIWKSRISIHD